MKNKFMVLKLKEVIKTAILAIIGIIIIILVISFFTGDENNEEMSYVPGVYTSSIMLDENLINVEVTVSDNKIENLSLIHTDTTLPVFYPLFESVGEDLFSEIKSKQSLNVDIPDGTEVTSGLILDSVRTCLEKAKK